MLAEACLQTLANGLLLFCFHVHQPQNRNVWNLEMSGVYHRTTIPETLFGIFCGGTRTSTNIQGCYQHLTEKKCGKWPILIKWTWLSFTYNGLDQSWYRLVCSISSNNEPLGDRDDSQRPPREMEWMERNMWGFLRNQGNTKETMSSSKQSITNI